MLFLVLILGLFLFPFKTVFAHEAYVLPYNDFWEGVRGPFSEHALDSLKDPHNLKLTIIVVVCTLIALILNFIFRWIMADRHPGFFLERFAHWGSHFVRITISIALFFSAWSNTFLGPELHLDLFPYSQFVRIGLFAISFMIAFGFLTEVAALAGTIIFVYSYFIFSQYIFTYLNYLGEFIVLLLFGMRVFSVDKYIFGPLRRFVKFEKYETVIVRVMYGLALIFAAISVKLLHPDLTISVVNTWSLTKFHWLFPSDPLLVTLGAGIVEAVIGLFIIFGFELRLTVLVSLFYITLSLFYFRELVWPHLLLYGISFNLIVQPETFTVDHIIFSHHRKQKRWWLRPFMAHNKIGKSNINNK